MRLGLAGGPLPRTSDGFTPELAGWLASVGVRSVALHLEDADALVDGEGRRIRELLAEHDVVVAQSTGYKPNLVDPDAEVRREALRRLRQGLVVAHALGAVMVNTGCGSRHPSFSYGPDPKNHTAVARDTLVANLREVCPEARDRGLLLSLEPHLLTTLSDPGTIRSIVDEVADPALRVNFDPVNLLGNLADVYDSGSAIRHIGAQLGAVLAPSAHAKDIRPVAAFVLRLDEVPPGEGYVDWRAYFDVCRNLDEGSALIVEHLETRVVDSGLRFVEGLALEHGVSLE